MSFEIIVIVLVLISFFWLKFSVKKNNSTLEKKINEINENTENNLNDLNENISKIDSLLETYKKVVEEKNEELKKFKEGGELLKMKGLFVSLIDILEFIDKFRSNNKNLNEQTQNYVDAIYDKLDIVLINSGIEKFSPEINQNLLQTSGCTPLIETKKTKDKKNENNIANIIKPGYRLQLKENEFIILKNAEVQIYELDLND
jgi:molecular chaperone GrpE (heat shock protein)